MQNYNCRGTKGDTISIFGHKLYNVSEATFLVRLEESRILSHVDKVSVKIFQGWCCNRSPPKREKSQSSLKNQPIQHAS